MDLSYAQLVKENYSQSKLSGQWNSIRKQKYGKTSHFQRLRMESGIVFPHFTAPGRLQFPHTDRTVRLAAGQSPATTELSPYRKKCSFSCDAVSVLMPCFWAMSVSDVP